MGQCFECHRPADAGRLCSKHWFERVARNCLKLGAEHVSASEVTALAATIAALWDKQRGRCALTNERLVPGDKRVSLDHITPRARGGTDEASNLRWVTFVANRAKSALTDAEFLEMCRGVVRTLGAETNECRKPETSPPAIEVVWN